jgi:hypothetical protein
MERRRKKPTLHVRRHGTEKEIELKVDKNFSRQKKGFSRQKKVLVELNKTFVLSVFLGEEMK